MLVRPLSPADVPEVRSILTEWFGFLTPNEETQEVEGRIAALAASLGGDDAFRFVVAVVNDTLVGIAGLQSTNISPELFEPHERPVEAITVYVKRALVGGGTGQSLLEHIEHEAASLGFTALIIVSGSRYREIGYPFWTRRYGPPTRVDADYWGPGFERAVWRHELEIREN